MENVTDGLGGAPEHGHGGLLLTDLHVVLHRQTEVCNLGPEEAQYSVTRDT